MLFDFREFFSFIIAEKDTNGDVLWTWAYPSITYDDRSVVLRKCGLLNDGSSAGRQVAYVYGHYQRRWYYLYTTEVFESDQLPKVRLLQGFITIPVEVQSGNVCVTVWSPVVVSKYLLKIKLGILQGWCIVKISITTF